MDWEGDEEGWRGMDGSGRGLGRKRGKQKKGNGGLNQGVR